MAISTMQTAFIYDYTPQYLQLNVPRLTPNNSCSVPTAPSGVSVNTNIKFANVFHIFSVVNLPVFYELVRNKGPMDYEQGARTLSDTVPTFM